MGRVRMLEATLQVVYRRMAQAAVSARRNLTEGDFGRYHLGQRTVPLNNP